MTAFCVINFPKLEKLNRERIKKDYKEVGEKGVELEGHTCQKQSGGSEHAASSSRILGGPEHRPIVTRSGRFFS